MVVEPLRFNKLQYLRFSELMNLKDFLTVDHLGNPLIPNLISYSK